MGMGKIRCADGSLVYARDIKNITVDVENGDVTVFLIDVEDLMRKTDHELGTELSFKSAVTQKIADTVWNHATQDPIGIVTSWEDYEIKED